MSTSLSLILRRPIWGKAQVVAYTGTAGTSTAMPIGTNSVMVWCGTIAHVAVGLDPTATTADMPLPANAPVVIPFDNNTGQGFKVSAVQAASGGNLYIQPLAD